MTSYHISPSSVFGSAQIPPSKSHTLRAIFFAAVANGESLIHSPLSSPDTTTMLKLCSQLGASIHHQDDNILIKGSPDLIFPPYTRIHAGQSGIVFRFATALAAAYSKNVIIEGDTQLQRRPILPLIKALENLGAKFSYDLPKKTIPFMVSGPISSNQTDVLGSDSQYASALAYACSLASGPFSFSIIQPKEQPWFKLSLWWLDKLSLPYSQSHNTYTFPGGIRPKGFVYHVDGDFSSAAFLAVAALLSRSNQPTYLKNLNILDIQGDKQLFFLLQKLGAHIVFEDHQAIIYPSSFSGGKIDMDEFIDALPILAVLCCFASSPSHLFNAQGAKHKESNRITSIAQEPKKMGASIQILSDGLYIEPSPLYGNHSLFSHHDHRIAMALSIAALYAVGDSTIHHTHCVKKTFPNFVEILQSLHACIRES